MDFHQGESLPQLDVPYGKYVGHPGHPGRLDASLDLARPKNLQLGICFWLKTRFLEKRSGVRKRLASLEV